MPELTITCPHCDKKFSLSKAMTSGIEESIRKEMERQFDIERKSIEKNHKTRLSQLHDKLEKEALKKARTEARSEVVDLKKELQETSTQLEAARSRETALRKRERELVEKEKGIGLEVERRLAEESKNIWTKASEAAKAEQRKQDQEKESQIALLKRQIEEAGRKTASEITVLQEELKQKGKQLDEARDKERQILQKERDLFEREKTLNIRVAEEMQKERESLWNKATDAVNQQHRVKDTEKDKQIADLKAQIDELSRRAQQGSQQLQGESLELEVEATLRTNFPKDEIDSVAPGIRGGDVVQTIQIASGQARILWEIKNTKNWNDAWVDKLKDDQRNARADVAVIIARVLPKGISGFGWRDGIWISDLQTMLGLATALRAHLTEVAQVRLANTGRDHKMSMLYDYLTGEEFKQRVRAIVEAYQHMQIDLEKEKSAMQRIWNKREKQIQRALSGAAGMYGDLQGIVGASLPGLKVLELPEGEDVDDVFDEEPRPD
jgi:hypothetical protein